MTGSDSLKTRKTLKVGAKTYDYFSLKEAGKRLGALDRLPFSLKVLLENLLRHEDGRSVTRQDIQAIVDWQKTRRSDREIAYRPARVLMQDFTGVPAIVDLAAMREAMRALGGDPQRINPLSPVDLVIDHSVMVDAFASPGAFKANVEREYERNGERYAFLRWGQKAFANFRVVPPGTGICHQVNLEHLAEVVWSAREAEPAAGKSRAAQLAYPDTLVGTDSHTTMVNGLAVLGWGVGGIEAEAAMLGQPISMLIPEIVGVELKGALRPGSTATDLVLAVTERLRRHGVVGKFVEFFGPGLDFLTLADRATIANMAPEYGATCGFFPIDGETLRYLKATGRKAERIALVEKYAKAQGLWRDRKAPPPIFTETIAIDIGSVEPSLAGPKRPQDRVPLSQAAEGFKKALPESFAHKPNASLVSVKGADYELGDGAIVIAAITSCTNTSNPGVMLGAGLLAKKAVERGLKVKPWVKTSLAPGSQVVSDYLKNAGLQKYLDALGFHLVGYGCTTCIGNSGPLPEPIAEAIRTGDLVAAAVLSGNRNFEGRVNPHCKANYLASPLLCIAYALAGNMKVDIAKDPIGYDSKGKPVYLADIWPSPKEIAAAIAKFVRPADYKKRYADVFKGDSHWRKVKTAGGLTYAWDTKSTYIALPPYFRNLAKTPAAVPDIVGARALAILGDSITTDHISPAGSIKTDSPAGKYLIAHGVKPADFNSYGARRGHHDVMMRGTFANIRLKNEMLPGTEGGLTRHIPSGAEMPIYDAAMRYAKEKTPLVIFAGKEYGTGSSRDWAAKGTLLLGVRAVIAESFERIHRSNLVGMGILPLEFAPGITRKSLALVGSETFDILGLAGNLKPRAKLKLAIRRANGESLSVDLLCRIDTAEEAEYFRHGGVLAYVLRHLAQSATNQAEPDKARLKSRQASARKTKRPALNL